MVDLKYSIIWSKNSEIHLKKIYDYIKQDSFQNAENILHNITKNVNYLNSNPEHFSIDKYKLKNDGSCHAFEIYSYRISFRIKKDIRLILRIRSTNQKPLNY